MPTDIAKQLSKLKPGTITYLYCITGTSVPQPALKGMEPIGIDPQAMYQWMA